MANHFEYGDQRGWLVPALPPGCAFEQHGCGHRYAGDGPRYGRRYVAVHLDRSERAATEDGPGHLGPDLLPPDWRDERAGRDGLVDGLDLPLVLYLGPACVCKARAAAECVESVQRSEQAAQPGSDERPAIAAYAAGSGALPADR